MFFFSTQKQLQGIGSSEVVVSTALFVSRNQNLLKVHQRVFILRTFGYLGMKFFVSYHFIIGIGCLFRGLYKILSAQAVDMLRSFFIETTVPQQIKSIKRITDAT